MTIGCAPVLAVAIVIGVSVTVPNVGAPEPAPRPAPAARPTARPAPVHPTKTGLRRIVQGVATWYATGPGAGHAAAGPALRKALGHRWRGTWVLVCHRSACVSERLTDWCACGNGHVIDLPVSDFRRLAPPSRGVITVGVTR